MSLTPQQIAEIRSRPMPLMSTRASSARRDLAEKGRALDSIPWHVADRAWRVYDAKYRCGQTAEELARRGGMYVEEMDAWDPSWREASEATAREVLDHIQALVAHPDPAVALVAIRKALEGWK